MAFRNALMDVLLAPVCWALTAWARGRQRAIAAAGTALTPYEYRLARAAGVLHPAAVRVAVAAEIPLPLPWWVLRWVQKPALRLGLVSPNVAGMTLGHGIVLRADCRHDTRLLAHELTHVAQVERLGGLARFMRAYVRECVWPGYPRGPLEREARAGERLASATLTTAGAGAREDMLPYAPAASGIGGIAGQQIHKIQPGSAR